MTIDTQITQILRKDFGARIVSVKAERPLVKLILNRAGLNDDEAQTLEQQVREKLLAMDGVDMVRVVLTAEKMEQSTDTPECLLMLWAKIHKNRCSLRWHRARAGLANPPLPPIWRWRCTNWAIKSVWSMRIFMARPNRGFWAVKGQSRR